MGNTSHSNVVSTAFWLLDVLLAVPVLSASGEMSVLSAAAQEFKPSGCVSESPAQAEGEKAVQEQELANVSNSVYVIELEYICPVFNTKTRKKQAKGNLRVTCAALKATIA